MIKPFLDDSEYLSELLTRKQYIDPQLEKAGWLKKYIKDEVNSVKSDFKNNNLKVVNDGIEKGKDRFIDYLLLDTNNNPLAIIEAKRYSKYPEKGFIQATTYAKDIEKQTGKKITIFLTNGHEWKFVDENGLDRKVSGVFSQEDLMRRRNSFENEKPLHDLLLPKNIVDRPKSVEIVKKIIEHIDEGHRSALIQMATGTGKTRVAMALIKMLINSGKIRNVLFVADRVALASQAKNKGFKKFFSEPVNDLKETKKNYTGTLFVSTVQTLIAKNGDQNFFETFSPAYFDLIVYDEAHRSLYEKGGAVLNYFDAIKIGLTATPRENENKNTYELFECLNQKPHSEYTYDEAIRDGVLVPYDAHIISTKVLSLGLKGKELNKDLKDQLRKQEENPDSFEVHGPQFERVFTDDRTNEFIVGEFMQQCRKSDDGLPCKTIFFCAGQPHALAVKEAFNRLFPKYSSQVKVIISDMDRSQDEVDRFQKLSEPRIALSVGILDTGVDIPEICNLVFVKPVFSHIRFWQMIGRGTRNEQACEHKDWLPMGKKDSFLVLDFKFGDHSNIQYHKFKAKDKSNSKGTQEKIFENRVNLLKKDMTEKQKEIIVNKLLNSLKELDKDSYLVREKRPLLEKINKNKFELEKYVNELNSEIAPLMIIAKSESPHIASFILQSERLFGYILKNNFEKIDVVKKFVTEHVANVLEKERLKVIADNKDILIKVFQEKFWNEITFEDVEFLVKDIAPLMKYYEPLTKGIIKVNAEDFKIKEEVEQYNVKEDEELKEFIENNEIAQKIKSGEGITSEELEELAGQISILRPELTMQSIQEYKKQDFIVFLRKIIGLTNKEDPKKLIEEQFDKEIIETTDYNSKQIQFLRLLKKVFSERKHLQLVDLTKMPLSEKRPLDYFSTDELKTIINKCNNIRMR